ncbi:MULTISPECIES: hypothetical protein [unclassified Streptomyces]|uniref:hypothetical protein n=1 Tax=unclassified Streptomyces TaxID=2593676 RepID=UPI00068C3427
MSWGDREPVFVQRGRWVYNTRSPVARVLMLATVAGLVGFYLYVSDTGQWSESELRGAVHEAARELEARPQRVHFGYDSLIRDAIEATDEGPVADLVIRPTDDGTGSGALGSPTEDGFEISAAHLSETFCVRLSPPEPPRSLGKVHTVRLTVKVSQGDC